MAMAMRALTLLLPLALAQRNSSGLELRIAKGLGSKGYEKVRVSVIAGQEEAAAMDFPFAYREAFKYRWTKNYLLSSLMTLKPGANVLQIQGQQVVVDLPPEDGGIRGVFWADPCFSSRYVVCAFGQRFQTLERSSQLLNAAFEDKSMDLFGILGDNFYDQAGELTQEFFSKVSLNVKRRFWLMVNGNHDNWVCGFPICGSPEDDHGIGQMQYYPMDSVASQDSQNQVFSFIDPDEHRQWNRFLNNASNFIFYHKLGNVGFLGYTGAGEFDETLPHLEAACTYFAEVQPEVIFLLGHWNNEGLGCTKRMSVPEIHETLMQIPGCSGFGRRLKYMDGHEHCNYIQAKDDENYGFMIGGHGMADVMCAPQYGFAYLDTTNDRIRLFYFEVSHSGIGGIVVGTSLGLVLGALLGALLGKCISSMCRDTCTARRKPWALLSCGVLGAVLGGIAGYFAGIFFLNPLFPSQDRFDEILGCVQANGGLHGCTHLAQQWLNEPVKLPTERFWL